MVSQGKIKDRISDTNWLIYVLKLENNKFYIGITTDITKRFSEHKLQSKNCANWCKKHKPLKIIETINTNFKNMYEATLLEDIYTLKYIQEYGTENVRGGRFLGSLAQINSKVNSYLTRGSFFEYTDKHNRIYSKHLKWQGEIKTQKITKPKYK